MPNQERIAKRARLKEEDATAYIQAGTLPDGGGSGDAPGKPVISKETKVCLFIRVGHRAWSRLDQASCLARLRELFHP